MMWHFVNAMTYENATHRVRRVCKIHEQYWIAERKASTDDHQERIPGKFACQELAVSACERDGYAVASGR
jgi:hypothetical protein